MSFRGRDRGPLPCLLDSVGLKNNPRKVGEEEVSTRVLLGEDSSFSSERITEPSRGETGDENGIARVGAMASFEHASVFGLLKSHRKPRNLF